MSRALREVGSRVRTGGEVAGDESISLVDVDAEAEVGGITVPEVASTGRGVRMAFSTRRAVL